MAMTAWKYTCMALNNLSSEQTMQKTQISKPATQPTSKTANQVNIHRPSDIVSTRGVLVFMQGVLVFMQGVLVSMQRVLVSMRGLLVSMRRRPHGECLFPFGGCLFPCGGWLFPCGGCSFPCGECLFTCGGCLFPCGGCLFPHGTPHDTPHGTRTRHTSPRGTPHGQSGTLKNLFLSANLWKNLLMCYRHVDMYVAILDQAAPWHGGQRTLCLVKYVTRGCIMKRRLKFM